MHRCTLDSKHSCRLFHSYRGPGAFHTAFKMNEIPALVKHRHERNPVLEPRQKPTNTISVLICAASGVEKHVQECVRVATER